MASQLHRSGAGGSIQGNTDMGRESPVPPYDDEFDEHSPSQNFGPAVPEKKRLQRPPGSGVSRTNSHGYGRDVEPPYDDPSPAPYKRQPKTHGEFPADTDRESNSSRLIKGARGLISRASNYSGSDARDDRARYHDQPAPAPYRETRKPLYRDGKHAPKGPASHNPKHLREDANPGHRELIGKLERLEDTCEQLKQRNNALQLARDSREDLFSHQEPDSVISAQFHDIFSQVKSWANNFCREAGRPLEVSHVPEDQIMLVSRVVPSLESVEHLPRLLPPGDVKRRRKFVRGWIALNVAEAMFRSLPAPRHTIAAGSDIWIPSGPRDAIKNLEFILLQSGDAITRSAFHEWRALTFGLFDKMYPAANWPLEAVPAIREKVHSTVDVIKSFAPSDSNLLDLETRLADNVFIPAVKLSQVLRRQRACWYVRFPHIMKANTLPQNDYVKPYVFNPDFMKDVDNYCDDEDDVSSNNCLKAVEIIITPSLFKSGNHDGEQYDIEFPIEKAEVSCTDIHPLGSEVVS